MANHSMLWSPESNGYPTYNVFELSNALKPYALDMLFEDYQLDGILYFDSDIRVYRRLTPIFDALEQSNIVLTPHLTEPILARITVLAIPVLTA